MALSCSKGNFKTFTSEYVSENTSENIEQIFSNYLVKYFIAFEFISYLSIVMFNKQALCLTFCQYKYHKILLQMLLQFPINYFLSLLSTIYYNNDSRNRKENIFMQYYRKSRSRNYILLK